MKNLIVKKEKFLIILSILFIIFLSTNIFADNQKILFLIGEPYSGVLLKSIKKLKVADKITFFVRKNFNNLKKENLKNYKVFLVDTMYPSVFEILKLLPKNAKIYSLRTVNGGSPRKTNRKLIYDKNIIQYFQFPCTSNTENLLKYILNKELGEKYKILPPIKIPVAFLAHPDSDKIFTDINDYINWYKKTKNYHKNGFWIAICYYKPMLNDSLISEIVKKFEDAGINVIVSYSFPDYIAVRKFLLKSPVKISFFVAISYKFSASLDEKGKNSLKELNVPVYDAISLFQSSRQQWELSSVGLTPFEVSFQISMPELGGIIEPTVIGSKEKIYDSELQKNIYVSKMIGYQVDWLIKRIKKMHDLQVKPNKDKRIAIIYYSHPPGKQNIGASYLNVMKSLSVILKALRKHGYDIPKNVKLDYETLKKEMLLSGRNVGNYAPGEIERLVNSGKVVLLPISEYKKWIKHVPYNFIEPVYKKWGKPEDSKIMVYKGNFIIPMVRISKNIIILPQPSRGWGQSPIKMYHDVTLPPHHQYIAVYLWLKKVFKADCFINLGTHGTHEWMPGKQAGTIYWNNGDFLVQDIPVLYPYIMDDIGEALEAKRRGRGIIISHLTPVILKGNLYDKYAKLEEKIQEYDVAKRKDKNLAKEKFRKIKQLVEQTGILNDLRMKKFTEKDVEKIEHYLIELTEEHLPYGLHTFGYISDNGSKAFAKTLKSTYPKMKKNFQKLLKLSAENEIKNLLKGLNGEFIPPGPGNDPLRNIDALPTGRDLYAFDSAKIPSKEAYELGKKLVNQSLEKYRKEHKGKYPEKVEVILWAVETCRDEGIAISQALYYMGVKPVWDKKDRVIGVTIIPGKKLGRPRIDVLMQPSGLFRDMFPNILKLLDKAVQMAKNQKDIENFIQKHSLEIEKKLIKMGYSKKEAKILSDVRIFSEPPGAYGTMVAELTGNSGLWDNDTQIGEVFINRLSYGYSQKFWGKPLKKIYKLNAKDVKVVVHTLSTNLYGTMDNDDFFQYAGGAVLAVRTITGKSPELYVSRSANPQNVYVENINKTIGKEFRERYTNPKWIKGMMKEGYAGAREMSKFVDYMWGWQVTVPKAIDQKKWLETYNVYVKDKYKLGIRKFFEKENPWAYQSITARMLEAVRKGYWKPNKKILEKLAAEYALNVVNYGVACCDHTCNNPMLNQMVANIISLPGVLSPEVVEKFKTIITKAMGKSLKKAVQDRKKLLKRIGNIIEKMKDVNVNGKVLSKKIVKGYELKQETKKQDTEISSSGLKWYLTVFVIGIIFLIVLGYVKRNRSS